MTEERYRALEWGESVLTYEELNEGWHFCPDWDFSLLQDGQAEPYYCEPYNGNRRRKS